MTYSKTIVLDKKQTTIPVNMFTQTFCKLLRVTTSYNIVGNNWRRVVVILNLDTVMDITE